MLAMSAVVVSQLFRNFSFFLPQISSGGGLLFFFGVLVVCEILLSTFLAKQGSKIGDPPESLRSFSGGNEWMTRKEKKKTVIPQSLNHEEDWWGVVEELGDVPKMVPWSTTVESRCHARCRVTVSQGLTYKLSITCVLIS